MPGQDNLIKVFEYALNQEKTGMSFFQASLKRLGIGAAVSAFERLIQEEQRHIDFINRVLGDLKDTGRIDLVRVREVVIEPVDFFDARARSEFLEQGLAGSMVPDVTVFNMAWLIERDLSEFYAHAASKAEGAPASAFQMLADWEKRHELFFKEYRDRLTDEYSRMPWGG
ncbi:MAG: ferritin family protein [Proteobacteria bacterium]|nr:ferritin family protein [Pseudomonadota bacterium]